ncbi:MAG: Alcohol dehydrogenase YqhD [Candidatus Omnitrophica bacterium ADurb.Bin277]|nr:MAG: Alcohol dehydrogenase YqhD [Candidatus Omnitrophica bacterium ADurb.Bin277]
MKLSRVCGSREKNGVSLYEREAAAETVPVRKNALTAIIAEEKSHQFVPEDIIKFVAKPGFRAGNAEFSHTEKILPLIGPKNSSEGKGCVMDNFIFKNPTEILFGKGMIAEIKNRIPGDRRVLFLYGGGSVKRNGVYEQVKSALRGRKVVEFSGIEPNPLFETCLKAVSAVKKNRINFILAAGGGSVLDAGKFIAAAALFRGNDPWAILKEQGANVTGAIPVGAVLTLPATGSESNGNSVISKAATSEKLHFYSPFIYPVFSVLDPETTFSLPSKFVRNGIVDAFIHVMEQYLTYPARAPLQDRFAEAILQTLVDVGPLTLRKPGDYEARAAFMWAATLALNSLIGCGVPQDWSTHMIGHEITAFYGLDHAETLAIILPGVWEQKFASKKKKLEQYAGRVWGAAGAHEAVRKTEEFFHSLHMPTRFSDYGISAEEAARKVRDRFRERGYVCGEHGDIGPEAAAKILRSRA